MATCSTQCCAHQAARSAATAGLRSRASCSRLRVARQVSALLAQAEADEHLALLLNAAPHTAALYENLHYDVADLCRSPLEAALNAELSAAAAIGRARRG